MTTNKPVESVSHAMPESVREILQWMELSGNPPPGTVFRACKALEDAYAKIAELEKDLKEYERPQWTCADCGYDGDGFETIKNEGDPSLGYDYDMVCAECSSDDIRESPSEVINHLFDKQNALISQLSTLQAQMKEVIEAGNKMAVNGCDPCCKCDICEGNRAWKAATASLRQSGVDKDQEKV